MKIHPSDSVEVRADGHKYAIRPIAAGENVIKYGMPIGHATRDIAVGEHVHTHNLATNLGNGVEKWSGGGVEKWSGGGVEKWSGGGVEKWSGGGVEKWSGGEVEKWSGGVVEKWSGGEVEKWSGGVVEYLYADPEPVTVDAASRRVSGKAFEVSEGRGETPRLRAFRRSDGRIGIRNDIWIVPTVGCVNRLAQRLAEACGGIALTHPYGCSQLGDDHETTANLLAALCRHPNAGGVLVVGLGCENNTLESFMFRVRGSGFDVPGPGSSRTSNLEPRTSNLEPHNIRFLRAQDPGDEYERGLALVRELEAARPTERVEVPVSELVVGLKCGGSDGFSGLTANPLVGRFSDWLVAHGGSTVLTEVPEMFGAETLLMKRCRDRTTFEKCVKMITDFKGYYARHGQPCCENPSPGNKAGGITTLEDKSLGCVQKGGSSQVNDVLGYGECVKERGLSLLTGPGNDLVASTVLAAAGCHLILFTTGRGTPFGTVVPTVKIASNSAMASAKPHWIDWDAMANPDVESFARRVLAIASGEPAANERAGDRGIAIFKDGVTL